MDFGIPPCFSPRLVSQFETTCDLRGNRGVRRNREFAAPSRHRIPDFVSRGRLDFLLSHRKSPGKGPASFRCVYFPYLSLF
jgi:hypothetical protein